MAMPIFHFGVACISKRSIQYLFKYWCARSLGTYGILKANHGVNDATFLCLSNAEKVEQRLRTLRKKLIKLREYLRKLRKTEKVEEKLRRLRKN